MNRLISLAVGIKEPEEWVQTYQEISELAANLGVSHHYVSVSSSVLEEVEDIETEDELYHDENTIRKVHRAFTSYGLSDTTASNLIDKLQSAGILFRERR